MDDVKKKLIKDHNSSYFMNKLVKNMVKFKGKNPENTNKLEKNLMNSNSEEDDSEIGENPDKNYDFLNSDGYFSKEINHNNNKKGSGFRGNT